MVAKYHKPVLLSESVQGLNIKSGGVYVDVTFGGGGHSVEILKRLKGGKLFAFDQDTDAEKNVLNDKRFFFINQNFRHLKKMLRVNGVNEVDGILADLGISSHQLDESERGFAHRLSGTLDMRMDQEQRVTAVHILNTYTKERLQEVFSAYGEVRHSRTLAERIIEFRKSNKIESVDNLTSLIDPLVKGDPTRYYSQVFQALRIEVNDELNALREFLHQSKEILKSGGRIVVISYHSLEDRMIKNFMRSGSTEGIEQKDFYGKKEISIRPIMKKSIQPSEEEIKINPRARSARLRIAEKT